MPMIWLDLKEAGEFAFNAAVKKVGVGACVRPAGGGEAPSGFAPGSPCGAYGPVGGLRGQWGISRVSAGAGRRLGACEREERRGSVRGVGRPCGLRASQRSWAVPRAAVGVGLGGFVGLCGSAHLILATVPYRCGAGCWAESEAVGMSQPCHPRALCPLWDSPGLSSLRQWVTIAGAWGQSLRCEEALVLPQALQYPVGAIQSYGVSWQLCPCST